MPNGGNWQDSAGISCVDYWSRNWCDTFGSTEVGDGGLVAAEACCECGGGDRPDELDILIDPNELDGELPGFDIDTGGMIILDLGGFGDQIGFGNTGFRISPLVTTDLARRRPASADQDTLQKASESHVALQRKLALSAGSQVARQEMLGSGRFHVQGRADTLQGVWRWDPESKGIALICDGHDQLAVKVTKFDLKFATAKLISVPDATSTNAVPFTERQVQCTRGAEDFMAVAESLVNKMSTCTLRTQRGRRKLGTTPSS